METKSSAAINIVTFVKLPGADAELALNPSAKVFREIKVAITDRLVNMSFATVTREAARGGYRNGGVDQHFMEMTVEQLLNRDTVVDSLGREPYAVVSKVLQMSESINNYLSDTRLKQFLGSLSN